MSPRSLTPLALAALVLFAGSALAVPVSDHGPPSEADTENESFALVSVYGPVLDDPVFTVLAQEPREDIVYGPDLHEEKYNLRVLPDNWHQLTDDTEDEDRRNPWADVVYAPLQDAPDSGDDVTVPCGCPSHDPGHSDDDTANNGDTTTPSGPSDGDDAPNTGEDGDDVDDDDGMDGDDSDGDGDDSDGDGADSDDSDDVDRDDSDVDDSDADDSDSDDADSDDPDGDDDDSDDSDSDGADGDDSDDSTTSGN